MIADDVPRDEAVSPPALVPPVERGSDVYRLGRKPLDAIFAPKCVAVIGASEKPDSLGRRALWNLVGNPFGGTVYPVNPSRSNVLGIKAYPTIGAVPEAVDLAIIVTPAPSVPDLVADCARAGVRGVIVVASGLGQADDPASLAGRTREQARLGRIRLIGPNSVGVIRPANRLNASVAGAMALPGHVGFLSQSGAMTAAILDWSLRTRVGFSAFGSVGTMLDVGWGDLIDYLGDDPETHSIVIAMESVGDARGFLSAAREVALTKPIIVIKPGRTEPSARIVAVHTGLAAESDDVLEAAFRRGGVLRAHTIADVFYLADVLAKQPRPRGARLAIVTNARGPSALAVDALVGQGGTLAELSPESVAALGSVLPPASPRNNPVDVGGDADPARFARAVEVVASDPGTDGVLVILAPQAMTDPTETAKAIRPFAQSTRKPILASWMGGGEVAAGEVVLNQGGIPTFPYPDTAARVFTAMARHDDTLRALYETPTLPPESEDDAARKAEGDAILARVQFERRTALDEVESKQVLAAHGLPMVATRVAANETEAVQAAEAIGWPVALKLYSRTVASKSEVGGVRLDLDDPRAVVDAFRGIAATVSEIHGDGQMLGVTVQPMVRRGGVELAVSSWVDPQFGPILEFGSGGALAEVYCDRSLALPPLTSTLARRLMERTRIYAALRGDRGRTPVDLDALERFLVRLSRLVVERPRIKQVEIAPIFAWADGVTAVDARVILHGPEVADEDLPRPAIRPYPAQYASTWVAKDGGTVTIRPIRAEDEPSLVKFHETLSERSVALRYFQAIKLSRRVAHDRLTRICFNDYDREIALVVDHKEPWTDLHEILGVGRLSKLPGTADAEFALLINDTHQGRGLGTELLRRLLAIARVEKVARVTAEILADNHDMRRVCEKLGFHLDRTLGDPVLRAWIDLDATAPAETAQADPPVEPTSTATDGV